MKIRNYPSLPHPRLSLSTKMTAWRLVPGYKYLDSSCDGYDVCTLSAQIDGASLSEAHINRNELHERYVYNYYIYGTSVFPSLHSTKCRSLCCSNSAICKFTLVSLEARLRSSIAASAQQRPRIRDRTQSYIKKIEVLLRVLRNSRWLEMSACQCERLPIESEASLQTCLLQPYS